MIDRKCLTIVRRPVNESTDIRKLEMTGPQRIGVMSR